MKTFSDPYAVVHFSENPLRMVPRCKITFRVLLASEDIRFLRSAVVKLRGTPIHPRCVTRVDEVAHGVARLRPHVLIVSQAFIDAAPSLGAVLAKRFRGLPVLVVKPKDGMATTRDWQVASFGGVGVVGKDKLLEGQVLPRVIVEIAVEAMKDVHPKRV